MQGYFPESELTDDERIIIANYMLLPYIKRALEVDRKAIFASGLKFKTYYVEQLTGAIDKVANDIRINKKQVFDNHIRLTRKSWLEYDVYTRGRLFNFVYHKSIAVDWINQHVKDYFPQELDVII
ncbi:hypothetical protein [Sporolactobacillus laevolacticus]|uniref:Uncharacterized protein n=1 Tax=Sporolactobacillus laevolacticus DSM 442 TaxID=1395513 RepID=V6IZH0_9BACL|nr:hypothetical protein [Sporolactobacillus laevolacticus]EST12211.1 hypothetical protein P343_07825 [Sporolactobacillus laevolacticus DSM 442]